MFNNPPENKIKRPETRKVTNKKQRTTTNDKEKKKYRGYWTALALKSKAEKIEKKISSTEVLNSESDKARSVSSPNGTCIGELNKKSSTGIGINATVKVSQNNDDSGIREIAIRKKVGDQYLVAKQPVN